MIERILSSPYLYPLFRIGWLERIIFLTIRWIMFRFSPGPQRVLQADLFGFDFSKWQGRIDFSKVLAFGAKFLILRASYGVTRDERFVEYMQTAPQLFLGKLSVYGYYYPHLDPVRQANTLLETIAPYRQYIKRVYGDFEFVYSGAYEGSAHWKKYAETILAAGYEFGVYTRKTWWDSRVGALVSWFGQFPGFFAQYAPQLTMIPRGWTKASIWQKGTPALDVGTESKEVDLDIADDQFYMEEYGDTPPPPPPPTGPVIVKRIHIYSNGSISEV